MTLIRLVTRNKLAACVAALLVSAALDRSAGGATSFQLTNNAHGITNQAAATATSGAYQMSLSAGPAGAMFNESSDAGLGVDSSGIAGAVDVGAAFGTTKLNVIGGASPFSGQSAAVTFSFDRSGVIRDVLFDGVKDETLEFLRLTLPSGGVITFFDFEVPLRLTQQGFPLTTLTEPDVRFLLDGNDDLRNVNLPFQAGQQFTLSYGEFPYPPGYAPLTGGVGNGARWEGLVIVPEPCSIMLALWASSAMGLRRRRRPPTCG